MKTTKRSKMLISSIAMLLVALVALGSATYAWYQVNREVTGDTMNVSASVPTGLLISKTNTQTASSWDTSVELADAAAGLQPVSLVFDGTGVVSAWTASAATVNAYGKGTDDAVDVTATKTDYYVVDTFYVKATGADAAVKARVKLNATLADSFLNFAVVDITAGKVLGVVKSDGTSYGAIASAAGTQTDIAAAAAVLGGTAVATAAAASTTYTDINATTTTITAETASATNAHEIQVFAYADGQNSNCKTVGAVTAAGSFSIQFYY